MRLSTEHVVFQFSGKNAPALRVSPPVSLTVETMDCFANQLQRPEDSVDQIDWDRVNPATGPIYVEGAEPGDALKVTIDCIQLGETGAICCLENEGVLGHMLQGSHTRIVPIKEGKACYLNRFEIPLKKMIGVIGVAPESGEINNGVPGPHGGNMDTLLITEGATLYLPVFVPGALFALGDLHAVMGNGEIGVTGLEIPGEVSLRLDVIKGRAPEYPMLENEESWAVIASAPTTDQAIVRATEQMLRFLEVRLDMSPPEIIMFMSMVGQVEVSQVVDAEKTVRFVFPKRYLPDKPF